MCGIAGYVSDKKPKKKILKLMTDRIAYRGPDAEGFFLDDNAALGHRRLAIIDLSTGNQPIYNEEKDIAKLEEYITNKKNNTSTEEFFYNAGMAFMDTMNYVDKNEGCDGLNASISGLNMFEDFIGLRNEDDEY